MSTTCAFSSVNPDQITRIVTAVVDQTVACTDTALDLLDALEIPLGEAIHRLSSLGGIDEATVEWLEPGRLWVTFRGQHLTPASAQEIFGESAELIAAFFDSEWTGAHELRLGEVSQ